MKSVKEERFGLTDRLVEHLELCVQCRACEAVCPSGVPFGRVMEQSRAQIATRRPQSLRERLARWAVFRLLLPRRRLLRSAAWLLRLYQMCGLQWAVREFGLLRPFKTLHALEQQQPRTTRFFTPPRRGVAPAKGTGERRVAMLDGCVMPLVFGPVNEATVRVLTRGGCDVVFPKGQTCCGALHTHAGEREAARALARKNIDAFLEAEVEAVVVNSAGCGAAMKEYPDLLAEDDAYRDKAARFASLVRDVTEYLAALPSQPLGALNTSVTYQDSCHLAHAQGIRDAPRALMSAIPGLQISEMEGSDMCCGAGGIYSFTHQELSNKILDHKIEHASATGASVIAMANPGCMLQLERGLRRAGKRARIAHVVELVDEAQGGRSG